jgi:putative hydrolase of the HAD superfamily
VIFDFYGTLARATAWGPTHEDVLAHHGYGTLEGVQGWLSDDGLYDGQEHHEHSRSRAHYRAWELERLRALARRAGVGADDLDVLVADLDAAGKQFTMTAFPEARRVLEALRAGGLVVGVCSNWDWDLDRALEASGLADLVDHQVTSARAGARKPNPHIFERALAACGVAAAEALFVGDSLTCDVQGPLRVGIPAVHVWRREEPPPPLPARAERVADLDGVLHLLEHSRGGASRAGEGPAPTD